MSRFEYRIGLYVPNALWDETDLPWVEFKGDASSTDEVKASILGAVPVGVDLSLDVAGIEYWVDVRETQP